MNFCNAEDIILITGLKPTQLRLKTDEELENLLNDWIYQAEDMIIQYTHNNLKNKESIPATIKNVCIRLVSNMVAFSQARRDTPVIKYNDWTTGIISSNIFTEDLKADLKPFVKDTSNVSDSIDFFTITGD